MKMARQTLVGLLLVTVSMFSPGVGFATENVTANGLNVGGGRLHPFFDFDARYDSAGGYFAGTNANLRLSGEIVNQYRPGLNYEWQSPSTSVNFDGALNYVQFTGLLIPASRGASRFQGDARLGFHFNREGAVGLKVSDTFVRTNQTQNLLLAVGALMLRNEAKAELPIRPGGKALEIIPSAAWMVEMYDPLSQLNLAGCAVTDPQCSPTALAAMNFNNINFSLENRWKFFPKTSLLLNGRYDLRTYAATRNQLLRVDGGIQGLLSSKIGILATGGYAYDFALPSAQSVIGQFELTYHLNDVTKLSAGYLRNLTPMALYGAMRNNRVYLEGRALLTGKLAVRARASADWIVFFRTLNSVLPDREDQIYSVDAGPEIDVASWVKASLGYAYNFRASTNSLQGFNFPRHEAYMRLYFSY